MVPAVLDWFGTLVDNHGHKARANEQRERVEEFVDLLHASASPESRVSMSINAPLCTQHMDVLSKCASP